MNLDSYIEAHTSPQPEYLEAVERATNLYLYNPRMCSGSVQGRLLKMLMQMIRPKLVLELGTFSAYSALSMAEGLSADAQIHTIEANDELEDFIRNNLARSPYGSKVHLHIGEAATLIPEIAPGQKFDVTFIDADKREYPLYYQLVKKRMTAGGFIIADNTLWDGHVLESGPTDRQTAAIIEFNDMVAADPDVEQVILPIRDGLSLIRIN